MAGGRKNDRPRATLSPYENFGRDAERNIVTWTPCGLDLLIRIWQELAGHELSPQRASEFRSRLEARKLAGLHVDDVRAAAEQAHAEHTDGHLLLVEWLDGALALALIRHQVERASLGAEDELARQERKAQRAAQREREEQQIAAQRRAAQLRAERESGPNPRHPE